MGKLEHLKQLKKAYLQQMFPRDGESVPRVRFDGFSGEWERRKLGDVAEFSKGSGYSKQDLQETGTPIILYGRLYTNYETVISEIDTFVTEIPNSIKSKGKEVVVPASGETADEISRASVVEKAGVILGGDLNVIRPNEEIHSVFLALTISNGRQQKEMSKRAQGKSVVHLYNSDLKEVELTFPTIPEQQKIGRFFEVLDELIKLHS
jgi:type I restriction enzyme S subunit